MKNKVTGINHEWCRVTYPMNLMLVFMDMDDMLGKDLEGGLNNLKTELEN